MHAALAFILGVGLCLIYVEIDPHMKNIWIRRNSSGERVIKVKNMLYYVRDCFRPVMWHPTLLASNCLVWGLVGAGVSM